MATGSTGVYGGVDYNTADATTKKKLIASRLKLDTDTGYKQSETTRALQAVKDREASGQDTAAQRKYLTNQLGYTGAIPSATPAAASIGSTAAPVASAPAAATTAKPNYNTQSNEMVDLMKAYATKQATPFNFSYDVKSDPEYQAALQRASTNIDTGNAQNQAEMNRRGILNSSITSDRGSEIAAKEMGNVETTVVPQLSQQAYSRQYQSYADQQAQEQARFAQLGNLAQMYTGEDQRGIDNTNTRAGLTGNLPGDGQAQQLVSQLMDLKSQAETKGITAAERTKLSNQADGIRAMLSTMGVDSSQYGANVTAAQAGQVTPTIRTLQGQALDSSNKQADQAYEQQQWANRFNYGQAIGRFGNGQQTLDAQSMTFNQGMADRQQNFTEGQQSWSNNFQEGQQNWNNNFQTEQFAYQQARDAVADTQWSSKFNEDVRQYGLGYGLQQLSRADDNAYRQATLAISEDDNSRAWLDYEAGMTDPGAAKYSGLSVNQAIDALRKSFTVVDDKTGLESLPTDMGTKDKIYQQTMSMGLPDGQDSQAMLSLGLTAAEIAALDKKYGVSGN